MTVQQDRATLAKQLEQYISVRTALQDIQLGLTGANTSF
jgi:hypothetical protein